MNKRRFQRDREAMDKWISKTKASGRLVQTNGLKKGELHIMEIRHEAGCPVLNGNVQCTCENTDIALLKYLP